MLKWVKALMRGLYPIQGKKRGEKKGEGREEGGRVRQREWRKDERKDKRYVYPTIIDNSQLTTFRKIK